ncbi:Pentatricopeptide repeat-containing protein At5g19020, mitochondrial [Linum grandiflorum]
MSLPSFKSASFFPRLISSSSPVLRCFSASASAPVELGYLVHRPRYGDGSRLHRQATDHELALVSALKSSSVNLDVSRGRQIHGIVLKTGLDSNNFVENSLINMYAKCGCLGDAQSMFDSCPKQDPVSYNIMISAYVKSGQLHKARKLFDVMPKRGCVSYTTMIMGFAQNDFCCEAVEAFKEMRNAGVLPNEVTLSSLISACSNSGGVRNCRMFHGLAIKMLFDQLVLVSTNLLRMYCLCSSLTEARTLFNEMQDRNIFSWNVMLNGYAKGGLVHLARDIFDRIPDKDVVSWGTIIDGYVRAEKLNEALSMYRSMICTGVEASDVLMVDLVSACRKALAICEGQQLHSILVKRGFDCYDFIQATITHLYAACGKISEARLQFDLGIKDNIALWNALMSGFVRVRMVDQAVQLFDQMPERDVFSWSTMISGYAQSEQPGMAIELFHQMVEIGIQPNEVTMVSVFSAIASLGTLEVGIQVHQYILDSSIPLNDNLCASIIDMYGKCGSISNAWEMFHKIRDKAASVSPWNAIICTLAMHGHANLSLDIYADLQTRGLKLNAITFIGVLSACCHAGMVDLGKRYFESMKWEHNVSPDIKHYGCMVDLLGRSGQLEEAEKLIRSMPMEADVVIWGTLLAACRTHENMDMQGSGRMQSQ